MSHDLVTHAAEGYRAQKARTLRTIVFMSGSAIIACGGIIVYFNLAFSPGEIAQVFGRSDVATMTLMPYMISAVIAALTAIGVISILPTTKYAEPSMRLVSSLRDLADGDLTVRLKLNTNDPLRDVANELNLAVGNLDAAVTAWKVQNRIQWGALCRIRMAAEHGDCEDVLHFCNEMERNWDKIAEIENKLLT
ncbi:MAG: hypothetical protein JSU65_12840 [Candidatus Zixiibacteriota bacterium]|nr:MAG: hypothetical protein JSU65_12840 [candidate division Zixibacteria bacterium]